MTQHPPRLRYPNLFSIFLIVLLATNYFVPFADLDFTWQIRTGAQIVHTGQLRPVESFTYTLAGQQVPEFEGLYEVILYVVWSGLGFGGLKLLKTIMVAAPLILLALRLRKEWVPWYGIALSLLLAIGVLSPAWNLRPLYCTTIGLLLVSGWLHDHCSGRRPLTWWLPLVMCLWANLHPGVITGQGLLLGALGAEWLNRWLKINQPLSVAACRRLTLVGGTGLLATFASTDPFERLLYPFRSEVAHPIQRIFVEMQPTYVFLFKLPYTAWLVYLLALVVAMTVVVRFRYYRLWEVALLLGVTGLANLAVRSLQDWVLIMLALGVPHVTVLIRQLAEQRRHWRAAASFSLTVANGILNLDRRCKRIFASDAMRWQTLWPALAFALLAVVSLIPPVARRMPIQNGQEWPVAALDWAERQGLHGRFFAPPDYGSYLTWRLGDRARCYVDTRGFFFPAEVIADSHYVPQLGPDWEARLERILAKGTDYFLLETTGARGQFWHAIQPYVDQPLYRDEQTVLLSADQVRNAWARVSTAVQKLANSHDETPG
jgi:hypothetical protein